MLNILEWFRLQGTSRNAGIWKYSHLQSRPLLKAASVRSDCSGPQSWTSARMELLEPVCAAYSSLFGHCHGLRKCNVYITRNSCVLFGIHCCLSCLWGQHGSIFFIYPPKKLAEEASLRLHFRLNKSSFLNFISYFMFFSLLMILMIPW